MISEEVIESVPFDVRSMSGDSANDIVANSTVSSLSVPSEMWSIELLNEETPVPLNSMRLMVRLLGSVLTLKRGVFDSVSNFDVEYSPELSASPQRVRFFGILSEVLSAACSPARR